MIMLRHLSIDMVKFQAPQKLWNIDAVLKDSSLFKMGVN